MESIRFKICERFLSLDEFLAWLEKAEGSVDVKVLKKIIPQGYWLEEVCGTKCSYIFLRNDFDNYLIGQCRYDQSDDVYLLKKGGK